MPISHDHELILIHIPKNAGTSIHEALDMDDCRHHDWKYYYRNYLRCWKEYFKFAVVRNPFDRVVSTYEYAKMEKSYWHSADGNAHDGVHPDYHKLRNASFPDAVQMLVAGGLEGQGWRKQVPFIYDGDDLVIDKVLRFEGLPDNFHFIMQELGIEVELPKLNPSNRKEDYTEYYSRREVDLVKRYFADDLQKFHYKFEGL